MPGTYALALQSLVPGHLILAVVPQRQKAICPSCWHALNSSLLSGVAGLPAGTEMQRWNSSKPGSEKTKTRLMFSSPVTLRAERSAGILAGGRSEEHTSELQSRV